MAFNWLIINEFLNYNIFADWPTSKAKETHDFQIEDVKRCKRKADCQEVPCFYVGGFKSVGVCVNGICLCGPPKKNRFLLED